MNAKEKENIAILVDFVKSEYFRSIGKRNDNYKNIEASKLYKKRRKATAFLRYLGIKNFNGRVYGKKNIRLIKNSEMITIVRKLKNIFINNPDNCFKIIEDYSDKYLRILSFFYSAFLWKDFNIEDVFYVSNFIIPTLKKDRCSFSLEGCRNKEIETKVNSYHYFPEDWELPDNSMISSPLIGIELELYHRNEKIFNQLSNFFYFQKDGSLEFYDGGIELTTYPLPFQTLIEEGGAVDVLCKDFLPRFGCFSQCKEETGLHIHLSKLHKSSKFRISLKKAFYSLPYRFLRILYGRDSNTYCRIEDRINYLYQYGIHPSMAAEEQQNSLFVTDNYSRYFELNFTNKNTIEFRRGKGTVDPDKIKQIIDFCYFVTMFSSENPNIYNENLIEIKKELVKYIINNCYTESLKELISEYGE